jgi:hypothetical protein
LLASIERKWSQDSRMDAFRIYFFKQWIHSQYSKWQLFRSPPGYCSTNSPIEGYNNTIKQQYFVESFSYNILPATDVFKILINYESKNRKEYQLLPEVRKKDKKRGLLLLKQEKLSFHKCLTESKYKYKNYQINYEFFSCTCLRYFDVKMCKHLVAVCTIEKIDLRGLIHQNEQYLRARKRKGRRHDNLIVQSDESSNQSIIFNVSGTLVSPTPAISPITPPKRRGRPPNRTPALVNEPAKVSKKIVKKPAKIVKEQARVAKKPAKIVKEQAKVAKKPAKIVKEQAKVAKKPAKQPVTRTADKVLEQLEVEEKEDSIRRSQRVLSKKN